MLTTSIENAGDTSEKLIGDGTDFYFLTENRSVADAQETRKLSQCWDNVGPRRWPNINPTLAHG